MATGSSRRLLLAVLPLLAISIMNIGTQTIDVNRSQAIFSSNKNTDFNFNMTGKQNKPNLVSSIANLTDSSMGDLYPISFGYSKDKKSETPVYVLCNSTETVGNDSYNETELFGHRLVSSEITFAHKLEDSTEPFDYTLDSSTESVRSVQGKTYAMCGPDNSTATSGYLSVNTNEIIDISEGMSKHYPDETINAVGIRQQICTINDSSNNAAHLLLKHLYTQLLSTSENIHQPSDKCAGVNINPGLSSDSCEQRCGHVIAATDDNVFPCHCDQACWLYGDCCSDYYSTCLHLNINATSDRILLAVLDNLRIYSQVLQLREDYQWSRVSNCLPLDYSRRYIHMVNRCSEDSKILVQFEDVHRELTNPLSESAEVFLALSKQEIVQRCEQNIHNNTKNRVLDYIHVTLNHPTVIHFYNVFCAICNGITPRLVTTWAANIICVNSTLNFTNSHLLSNGTIFEDIMRDNCTIQNSEQPTCYSRSCIPRDSGNSDNSSVSNIQSSCMSWNYGTWLLCQRYQNYYVEQHTETSYKNLHCLLCHLNSRAQELSSKKESILSIQHGIMMLINECESDVYVCKNKSNNQCIITSVNGNSNPPIPPQQVPNGAGQWIVGDIIASFRIMFDFRPRQVKITVNQTVITVENKTCPQDQVYVPLYQSCRQVLCLPGTRWLHDQCVNVCSVTDTSKNKSCQVTGNQNIDYMYLPFPNGSEYLLLNIALDYIFGDDLFHNGQAVNSNKDNNGGRDDDDYINVESLVNSADDITATKTNSKTKNHLRIDLSRLASNCSLSFQFELSNLKNVWVKQMNKKINSTESKQNAYREMTHLVVQDIHNTVIHNLDNGSEIEHFIVCPNSTCLIYNVKEEEIGKDQPKVYPYNPCFDFPGRFNKTKSGTFKKPNLCLSFVVQKSSNDHFDNFVNATKTMVSDIVSSAHETNFILSRMEITNIINFTNNTQDMGTWTSLGSDVRFATSSSGLCQNNEVLVSTETRVERYNNGTHFVNVNGTNIELVKFVFNMEIYRHPDIPENGIELTAFSWCQVDLNRMNCGSFPITHYEPEYYVIYNGALVLTSMAEKLRQFLHQNQFKEEITDSMRSFAGQYGANNWTIVHNGFYIQIRSGALVCSNLTNRYQIEKHTLYTETKFRFMPDSEAEIVATLIASALSIFCLTCTLAVYSVMPSLRNVPGKIVMAFSATLLCAQVLFLCCTKPKGLACEVYASVHHAAWLSSYTWLGAMSVHLARILNSQCNIHIPVSGSNIFQILAAVCWGIPCLLAGVCLALHKTQLITIGYGNNGVCWIGNYKPLLIFVGAPVFLILAVTLVCSVVVLRAIRKSIIFRSKSTALQGKPHKQIILCVNLSLLMGFSWVFYFLAVGIDNKIVWTLHILVNGSQGLYVFLCFAARRSHLSTLMTKIKLGTIWARQQNVSSDITSLKILPATVTPLSSPSPSLKSFTISK